MIDSDLVFAADKLRGKGDMPGALTLYQRVYEQHQDDIKALLLYADALIFCRQAHLSLQLLDDFSGAPQTFANEYNATKAKALLAVGRWPESLEIFRKLVERNPSWADGWNNYGCALRELNRDSESMTCLKKAIDLDRCHESATIGLAQLYKKSGLFLEACTLLQSFPDLHESQKVIREVIPLLIKLDRIGEAFTYAQTLISGGNENIDDSMLYARTIFLSGRINDYIDYLDSLGNQSWKGVSVASIAIGTLAESGKTATANKRLTSHLEAYPTDVNARIIQSRQYLSGGDFIKGWQSYAHRVRLPSNQIHFGQKQTWIGDELKQRNVLVLGEQGIGDLCYFSRFLKPLIAGNSHCSILVEPRMVSLLESSFPGLTIFSNPKYIDFVPKPFIKIALGSLPLLYGNTQEEIQRHFSPLKARRADVLSMRSRIEKDSRHRFRVGISLNAGRPGDEYQRLKRSLPIRSVLEQLVGLPITLVDLQHHGHPSEFAETAKRLDIDVLSYPGLTQDIGLLAATISSLDLIVTAQQTNAHLTGALGKRGIVFLPPGCHFVYGDHGRSLWYPTLDLIRSPEWGKWDHTLLDELRTLIETDLLR